MTTIVTRGYIPFLSINSAKKNKTKRKNILYAKTNEFSSRSATDCQAFFRVCLNDYRHILFSVTSIPVLPHPNLTHTPPCPIPILSLSCAEIWEGLGAEEGDTSTSPRNPPSKESLLTVGRAAGVRRKKRMLL